MKPACFVLLMLGLTTAAVAAAQESPPAVPADKQVAPAPPVAPSPPPGVAEPTKDLFDVVRDWRHKPAPPPPGPGARCSRGRAPRRCS